MTLSTSLQQHLVLNLFDLWTIKSMQSDFYFSVSFDLICQAKISRILCDRSSGGTDPPPAWKPLLCCTLVRLITLYNVGKITSHVFNLTVSADIKQNKEI